ncbi:MAG TPA: metal-dependent hydrolase [Candidatus Andersenbacteria bacterium]|nr:metal-dependent hydrolase [Candidatus Andersenbacteria bacterium]
MNRYVLFYGMALAASLDASSGIIIAHLLCLVFAKAPTLLIYAVGAGAALLPDVSIPMWLCLPKHIAPTHHRDVTHYPLLVISIFTTVVWFSVFWASVISACLLAHFIDDTADPGGLAWLAPFSGKKYRILNAETEPLKLEDWLRQYYLRPTVKSVLAVILSAIAVIIVGSQLYRQIFWAP